MFVTALYMNKKEIRKKILEVRNNIGLEIKIRKDYKITKNVIDLLKKERHKKILLYASFGSEVDTWRIFNFCLENNIKIAFPKVNKDNLDLYWIEDRNQLFPGFCSILEPRDAEKACLHEIDAIFIPGVAFDKKGFRIGYGKGFYDRLLFSRKSIAIGLAYEEQIVEAIPLEPFDQKVDLIITDERIISCV